MIFKFKKKKKKKKKSGMLKSYAYNQTRTNEFSALNNLSEIDMSLNKLNYDYFKSSSIYGLQKVGFSNTWCILYISPIDDILLKARKFP